MPKFTDLTGLKFGRLTVVSIAGKNKHGKSLWLCQCECGNEQTIFGTSLVSGNTKSCDCLKKESLVKTHTKHGMSGTRLYVIWKHMTQRCENPNVERYKSYGGRGISVCDEWRKAPSCFINWAMSNGYKEGLSIDRIDVNGNYKPSNCRWVSMEKQTQNKTTSVFLTNNKETHCLSEWSRISGIPYETLRSRIKSGLSSEQVLSKESL